MTGSMWCPVCGSEDVRSERRSLSDADPAALCDQLLRRGGFSTSAVEIVATCTDCSAVWDPGLLEDALIEAIETIDVDEDEAAFPKECTFYWAGHNVHWIPALRSGNDRSFVPEEGSVTRLDGNVIVVEVGGEQRTYRNHDVAGLRSLIDERGERVLIDERWGLLKVPEGSCATLFSIHRGHDQWRECAPCECSDCEMYRTWVRCV